MIAEPKLELDDIQGHLLPGFGTRYQRHVYLKLDNVEAARLPLIEIATNCITKARSGFRYRKARGRALSTTGARPNDNSVLVSLAVSPEGAGRLSGSAGGLDLSDDYVRMGMAADAKDLSDPVVDGISHGWRFGDSPERMPDLVLLLGSEDKQALDETHQKIGERFDGSVREIWVDHGEMQLLDPQNLSAEFEHFGFRDGISQPVPRGTDDQGVHLYRRKLPEGHPLYQTHADFGKQLVWPGQFIFGYPKQRATDPIAASSVVSDAGPSFMRNGSYLVVRRLKQDVKGFWEHVDAELQRFTGGANDPLTREELAARLVGRWRNGAPLMRATDTPLDLPERALNHFGFRTATPEVAPGEAGVEGGFRRVPIDSLNRICPTAAHIRKVNPRDRHESGVAARILLHLFLRRGIPYGPAIDQDPTAERGLIFACYQTSVESQFRFVQTQWANSTRKPGEGQDRIIGQGPLSHPVASTPVRLADGRSVDFAARSGLIEMTGGGYFLVPGIRGLVALVSGNGP